MLGWGWDKQGTAVLRQKMLLRSRSTIVLNQLYSCYSKDINGKQKKSGKINRSLERLKLLETYSQELLKVDAKISQSEDVIQFFKAQTQDLDPCFPEDRSEILFVFFVCVSLHKREML